MELIAKALSIAKALRRRSRRRVMWTGTQKKEKMMSFEPRPSGKIVKKNNSVSC